jgi:hypothetical protein
MKDAVWFARLWKRYFFKKCPLCEKWLTRNWVQYRGRLCAYCKQHNFRCDETTGWKMADGEAYTPGGKPDL